MARVSQTVPHPRKVPRLDGPLTADALEAAFRDCVDFTRRSVELEGAAACTLTLCYLGGMVRMERVSDYVLRPLAEDQGLRRCGTVGEAMARMEAGALYNLGTARRTTLDQAAVDLVAGWCLLFFPGECAALSFFTGTEEKRSVSAPAGETVLKGARDGFVESVRTNTSIVRRHLKAPELRIREQTVGRQSLTLVDVLYMEGITDPALVEQVWDKLADMDVDGVFSTGGIEEYLVPAHRTPFPLVQYTERSDRFCAGLCEGGWACSSTASPWATSPRRCWAISSRPPRTSPPAGCWPPALPCCGTAACCSPSFSPPCTWPWSPSTRR